MSLLGASLRFLTNARAQDVAMVDANGDQLTGFDSSRPATATLTSVVASIVSVSLLAANAARRQIMIHNDGTKTLFVAFAATASATAFTVVIGASNTYVSPVNGYTGIISGIWNVANGNARITEVTT